MSIQNWSSLHCSGMRFISTIRTSHYPHHVRSTREPKSRKLGILTAIEVFVNGSTDLDRSLSGNYHIPENGLPETMAKSITDPAIITEILKEHHF